MITHQTQPTPYTCTHTCLAMLLGEPVERVIEVFGLPYGMCNREIHSVLDQCNFFWNVFVYPTMVVNGFYLIAAPSLNVSGHSHCLLVEKMENSMKVYDPNLGREGKKAYLEDGSNLFTWSDTVFVYPGGKLPEVKKI